MEVTIVKVKKVLDDLLAFVRADLANNVLTPAESWLYEEFYGVTLDDTEFYSQLSFMLALDDSDKRKLKTRVMFDKNRAQLPTIHVNYPAEDGRMGDNTINTGFKNSELVNGNIVSKYSRSYVGMYDLIITGGNSLEVVMLYEFLDALLIAAADTLAYNFDRFEFSGKQLLPNQDVIPYLIYYRAISINLQAKKTVTSLTSCKPITDISFLGELSVDNMKPKELLVSVVISVLEEIVNDGGEVYVDTGSTISIISASVNEGDNPEYSWFIDNVLITEASSHTLSIKVDNEMEIKLQISSSIKYLLPRPAESNILLIKINEIV